MLQLLVAIFAGVIFFAGRVSTWNSAAALFMAGGMGIVMGWLYSRLLYGPASGYTATEEQYTVATLQEALANLNQNARVFISGRASFAPCTGVFQGRLDGGTGVVLEYTEGDHAKTV